MRDKKNSSVAKLIGNKIFIILVAFSIAIICISLAFDRSIRKVSNVQTDFVSEVPVVNDVPDLVNEEVFAESAEASEVVEEQAETINYRLPVSGELQKDFSVDELLWDETMQDWRTHNGVDIETEDGAEVVTAAPGTVTEAYEDELYGFVVKVEHSDGRISIYKNMGKIVVKKDDVVDDGQMIGTVGNSGAFEMTQNPHLHFEIIYEEKYINPLEFIK